MCLTRVVFPAPFSPTIATVSPFPIERLTSSRAVDPSLVDEGDAPELYERQSPLSSSAISSGVSGTLGSLIPSFERAL